MCLCVSVFAFCCDGTIIIMIIKTVRRLLLLDAVKRRFRGRDVLWELLCLPRREMTERIERSELERMGSKDEDEEEMSWPRGSSHKFGEAPGPSSDKESDTR